MTWFAAILALALAPSCQIPDHGVTIAKAVAPGFPDSARDLGINNVTVLVNVHVDAAGKVTSEAIAQSSHNLPIDQSALKAARFSTYDPAISNCTPVDGTYLFRADFHHA